ncbi:DNA replication protein psf1 [Physocladia obscura]|uniref:DNA replication complex GINS protein PSF1 n=1 Tax=Physocladia obscura TaxID=109957 RepID=A0AAD5XJ94_9FUNG|nr:DNA replication protein psf1 [Physocladia obscura]
MSSSHDGHGGYGEEAVRLVREVKRANESGQFAPYNDGGVRNVKVELKHLYDGIHVSLKLRNAVVSQMSHPDLADPASQESLSQLSAGHTAAAQMNHQAMHRNKRLLLVYHRARLDALRDMIWELGGGAAAALAEEGGTRLELSNTTDGSNDDTTMNDTENSTSMPRQLSGLPSVVVQAMSPGELEFLSNYRQLLEAYRGTMLDVDLSAPLVPPKDLFIDVRVVKELGEIVTESGTILRLMKGDQLFVRRSDVEKFITLGYLVQM